VTTVDDLNIRYQDDTGEPQATWAWDEAYQDLIVERSIVLYGDTLPDQEGSPLPTFTTTVPGLPGGPLVTTYPIRTNMIPKGNTRQRPGIKAKTPRRSVQHGTGNPSNASAMAEAQYFVNGAEGRQASVHYFTDDREAVIGVPLDEVTWQAADGAGPGNMNGFSCEMMEASVIWNNAARRDALISITADLMGRTAARLGAVKPEQHWDFNAGSPDRHDCPQLLRHTMHDWRLAWDVYARRWEIARLDELSRIDGGKPVYAKSYPPEPLPPVAHQTQNGAIWLPLAQKRWTALKDAKRYQWADVDAPEVGPPIKAGTRVTFSYSVSMIGGATFFVSDKGSRVLAEAFVPVVE
jgi:hypothetical protein